MLITDIAKVCQEVNKAYCLSLGDDTQREWQDCPNWQRDSAINRVHFHIDTPSAGPEDSHNIWLAEKEKDGWKYGAVKDEQAKTHPCICSFEDLPREQQSKNYLFKQIVTSLKPYLVKEVT